MILKKRRHKSHLDLLQRYTVRSKELRVRVNCPWAGSQVKSLTRVYHSGLEPHAAKVLEGSGALDANAASRYSLYAFSAHSGQMPWLNTPLRSVCESLATCNQRPLLSRIRLHQAQTVIKRRSGLGLQNSETRPGLPVFSIVSWNAVILRSVGGIFPSEYLQHRQT
jgi:hypothetical protein